MKKKTKKRLITSSIALLLVVFLLITDAEPFLKMTRDILENAHTWVDFKRPDSLDSLDEVGIEDDTFENTEEVDDGDDIYEVIRKDPEKYYAAEVELAALGVEDATLVHYDAYSHTYLVGKNQYITVYGGSVGTYTDENGEVQLIDNNLEEAQMMLLSGKTVTGVANTANAYKVIFPNNISPESGIAVNDGEYQIEVIPQAGDYSNYTVEDNSILYNSVYANTDIQYTLLGNRIKEDIILLEPVDNTVYKYVLRTSGLTAEVEDNQVLLYPLGKTSEDAVYVLSAPYMEDAAGEISQAIQMELSEENGSTILTVTPDAEWLAEEERQYPVRIDPSITSKDAANNITFKISDIKELKLNTTDEYQLCETKLTLDKNIIIFTVIGSIILLLIGGIIYPFAASSQLVVQK